MTSNPCESSRLRPQIEYMYGKKALRVIDYSFYVTLLLIWTRTLVGSWVDPVSLSIKVPAQRYVVDLVSLQWSSSGTEQLLIVGAARWGIL